MVGSDGAGIALRGPGDLCSVFRSGRGSGHAVYNLLGNLMTETRDTVILGSGCAGLTAAIYSARANLKPLVLEGHEPGGQLSITSLVENFPGWPEGIQGPELIDNMKKQAARFGADFQLGAPRSRGTGRRIPFRLHTSAGEIHTRTLIIASGASARWLGIPSEQALIGHGVSSCATCDGFFFRDKPIAVVGGGDSAMEEASVSDALCVEGDAAAPAARVPRFEDHAGAGDGASQHRVQDEHGGG